LYIGYAIGVDAGDVNIVCMSLRWLKIETNIIYKTKTTDFKGGYYVSWSWTRREKSSITSVVRL